jgi:hypothetical protein
MICLVMEAFKGWLLGQELLSCELMSLPTAGKKNMHFSNDHHSRAINPSLSCSLSEITVRAVYKDRRKGQ